MREGMQIESQNISSSDKLRLLNALGHTGLKHIVVGSFVRPEYTPQMAHIDEILDGFQPAENVKYTSLLVNEKSYQRARKYSPPLEIEDFPWLSVHACEVFCRRNYNRSPSEEVAAWAAVVERAKERGLTTAGIGLHAAWGSNFTGPTSLRQGLALLSQAYDMLTASGMEVTSVLLGDPMSWNTPNITEAYIDAVKRQWPSIHEFHLHLHNARGMALTSAYSALRALDSRHVLHLDGSIGGIGGCPYCGNGRATGMIATEDLIHMLEGLDIPTGVDLSRVIDCVWLLEEILGRPGFGHVSKAGPRPESEEQWYDPNMPLVETFDEARHFKIGQEVYAHQRRPWKQPIARNDRVIT